MIKNLRYQFVLLYTVGDAALTAAVEDITLAPMTRQCPSAKTPACRCSGSRSQTQLTRTKPSRMAQSGKC